MKLSILLLILLAININADEMKKVDFGWSPGIVWFSYNMQQKQVNTDIDILHFSWFLNNKYIIGFDMLNLGFSERDYITILPLKLSYIPLTFSLEKYQFYTSFYGKMGWQWISHENGNLLKKGFFPSLGSQFFLQFKEPEDLTPYYHFYSFFVDYDFSHGLKYGFGTEDMDIITLGVGIFLVIFFIGSQSGSPGGF